MRLLTLLFLFQDMHELQELQEEVLYVHNFLGALWGVKKRLLTRFLFSASWKISITFLIPFLSLIHTQLDAEDQVDLSKVRECYIYMCMCMCVCVRERVSVCVFFFFVCVYVCM